MSKRILGITVLFLSLLMIHSVSNSEVNDESFQFYTIDGFEVPGEWNVLYSRFRSKCWNILDEKKADVAREDDKQWYDWFVADGTNFKRHEILPDFLAKHEEYFKTEKTILGFKARWDFHGHNYISIEPRSLESGGAENRYGSNKLGRYTDQVMANDDLMDQMYSNYDGGHYILLPGQTKEIALWVWGSKYDYTLEFHVEDDAGGLHVLNAGSTNFRGWRRMAAEVPNYIKQEAQDTPRSRPLKLKKIRLVQNPNERLSGTFIYFDYLHGQTNTALDSYMGEGLEKSERIWKKNKSKSKGSE